MKILITGSSGQLGSEIVSRLPEHQLITIDILPSSTTQLIMSITDRERVFEITRGVDVIVHTASLHGKHVELNYPKMGFIRTNIEGTLNLLEAAIQNGVKKFIYTSTTSIYGGAMLEPERAVWVNEELIPQPRDIYDITKQAAENLCKDFALKFGLPVFVMRISRFYKEEPNLIANYRLYRGIDVRDGGAAHVLAIHSQEKGFNLFNISADSPFQRSDLVELKRDPKQVILRYFPTTDTLYQQRNWRFPETIDRIYVTEKAKKLLGFNPRYNYLEYVHEQETENTPK